MQKKDVQPFIKTSTKDVIYKLSFITGYSVKQICEDLCVHTLRNKKKLAEQLSPYIKRNIKIENDVYTPNEKPLKHYPISGDLERVTIKLNLNSLDFAHSLAHSLGWSTAKVVAYCIKQSMNDFEYLNFYVMKFLEKKMDENRKEMINQIMKDINNELGEEHIVVSLLIGIVDDLKVTDLSFSDSLGHIVENW